MVTGDRRDCTVELQKVEGFGVLKTSDLGGGPPLKGRPLVMVVLPEGMRLEPPGDLRQIAKLNPVVMVVRGR